MNSTQFASAYQDLSQRFLRLLDDMSALRGLSSLCFQNTNEVRLLNCAMRVLMENQDLARCSIFLLEGDELRCATGLDWQDLLQTADPSTHNYPPRKAMTFALGQGILGMAAETGRVQHCHDCHSESRFLPADKQVGSARIGSLICTPIVLDGKTLGVVNVSHPEPCFFNESHERLLQIFASFLGQILSNWRYYHEMEEQIQRRTQDLETALAEAEELKRRYHQLSIVDELTGLHNRRFFFAEASTGLSIAGRHQQPFSVLMVDLDHFKQINDVHGHAMGDRILQIASTLLKAQTRDGDTLARFGGEEFVLALPNTDEEGAEQLADRILEALRAIKFVTDQGSLRVTASIGVACFEPGEESPHTDLLEHLLRQADQALYFGKAHGRDQSHTYTQIRRLS